MGKLKMWANVTHEAFSYLMREMQEIDPSKHTMATAIAFQAAINGGDVCARTMCILPFDQFEVELLTPENWR